MTPEEKAKELIEKFKPLVTTWDCYHDTPIPECEIEKDAAKCALICVEEIISSYEKTKEADRSLIPVYNYWQSVKSSIQQIK